MGKAGFSKQQEQRSSTFTNVYYLNSILNVINRMWHILAQQVLHFEQSTYFCNVILYVIHALLEKVAISARRHGAAINAANNFPTKMEENVRPNLSYSGK